MKILITGGTSGIGFLAGCVLSSRGHDVVFTVKTENEVSWLKEKVAFLDLPISILKLDITNDIDVNDIKSILKDVDVLFLHAGIGNIGFLNNMNIDSLKEVFDVNFFSNLRLIQLFVNGYDNKKVVITSSLLSGKTLPFFSSYSMSKKCIDIMVKTLRKENIFNNNSFVLIKPGAYHTGFNQYMVLSGEKNGINNNILLLLDKMFLCFEEKNINSIVYKIVIAIEKGNNSNYYAPFYQRIFMSLVN